MRSKLLLKPAVSLMFVLGLVSFAMGQTINGTITGNVVDQQGSAIAGATVTVKNVQTGLERSAVANDNGYFRIAGLPVATYSVRVEASGFAARTNESVQVSVGTDSESEI